MSQNYTAHYMFEHADSESRPEGKKYGQGVVVVNIEREPKTDEEFKEVARTIGLAGSYKSVAIVRLIPTEKDLNGFSAHDTLEGEIVID